MSEKNKIYQRHLTPDECYKKKDDPVMLDALTNIIIKGDRGAFEWYFKSEVGIGLEHLPILATKEELGIKKLIKKIPMKQMVMCNNNLVYEFHITPEGIRYLYLYSCYAEK
tara:strand:- start:6581 stop:6913 length:333 start_codon:yes stop_codon:yes gene_type:complete